MNGKIHTQAELERAIKNLHERYQAKIKQLESLAIELAWTCIRFGETREKESSLAQAKEHEARAEDLEIAREEMRKIQRALNMTVAEVAQIPEEPLLEHKEHE